MLTRHPAREEFAQASGRDVRDAVRAGRWARATHGLARGYVQANLAIVPERFAFDFLRFCRRNPKPCPLLEVTDPGDPEARRSAPDSDIRTDLPGYRVYRDGKLIEERRSIEKLWRPDHVAFLIGCSNSMDEVLLGAGISQRHLETEDGRISVYLSNIICEPAGVFHGPMVVSMRPIPKRLLARTIELTAGYPIAHGAPVHVGDPAEIGVEDLSKVQWGKFNPVAAGEIPVFWGCGVTPQAIASACGIPEMITHAAGHMFVTDLKLAALAHQEGHTMDRRQLIKGVTLSAAAHVSPSVWNPALAAYPSKPVTIIVPFAAGGAGDMLTRAIADYARNKRNMAVGVEYRPGAGGTIGPSQVARAERDGGIFGLYSVSPFLTVPHLQKVSYDTTKDFTYLAAYAFIPLAIYVPAESPLKDWEGVLRFAKDNPGRFRWGTSGVRGVAHIAVEAALRKETIKATFVPFTGGAEAITAMLGGHIEAVVSADYGPQLAAGKVRLLALTGSEKLAGYPNLPTFKELGYPLSTEAIYGIHGPAKLPSDVVTYWEGVAKEMMVTEEFQSVAKIVNAGPIYMDSGDFTKNVLENYRKLGEAIEDLGLKSK